MRFLCVSDIHGHAAALRAVMREAEAHGYDRLIACGDLCFPGPEPLEVWKMLVQARALCTQGVGDRALAAIDPEKLSATGEAERARIERLRKAHRELGDIIITRLGQLPPIARLPIESGHTLLVVHGSPADPTEPTLTMRTSARWASRRRPVTPTRSSSRPRSWASRWSRWRSRYRLLAESPSPASSSLAERIMGWPRWQCWRICRACAEA